MKLLKILSKIYSFHTEKNYQQLIELLEYLSPRSLECLEEILYQNTKQVLELNTALESGLNKNK